MLGDNGSKWLERLHMQLARELRAADWSQAEIATMLGSTQSTISRQFNRDMPELAGTSDEMMVDGWANELAMALRQFGPNVKLNKQRFVMEIAFGPGQILKFDKSLTGMDLESDQEERSLLKRLEWATSRIDASRISDWIPAVGMNIASCLDEADDNTSVASYPGRISLVNGRLRHHETPSFGSSTHLAGLLIRAREADSSKMAILNLAAPTNKGGVDSSVLNSTIEEMGWEMMQAPKGALVIDGETKIDCIIDAGAFGWEPSIYILAHNPLELVDRTHRFISTMEENA